LLFYRHDVPPAANLTTFLDSLGRFQLNTSAGGYPVSTKLSLNMLLDFAIEAAWQAGSITRRYFQTGVTAEHKADQTPVTIADRSSEECIRQLIQSRFPDHAVLGEEFGEQGGGTAAHYRWIIDPIDGTKAFVSGVPLYSVLIGLEHERETVLGVAYFPALN